MVVLTILLLFIYLVIDNGEFPHRLFLQKKRLVIHDVWSLYLHLGSLGGACLVSVGKYTIH